MVAPRRALRLVIPALLLALGMAVPARAGTASDESLLVTLINNYRVAHGLHALAVSSSLRSIATWRSGDMLSHDYQGHQIPSEGCNTVSAVLRQHGISFRAWGEIYAWNYGDGSLSATKAFDWWLGSTEHRTLILDPSFTTLGVGAAVGTWGSRAPACAGDSSGLSASGVHMYTVDFIEGRASSTSSGSRSGASTPRPAARPSTPRASRAAPVAAVVVDRRPAVAALLDVAPWPAGEADAAPPHPAAASSPASSSGPIGVLMASIAIAVGFALGAAGLWRRAPA